MDTSIYDKDAWGYRDVMAYCNCKKDKAYSLIRKARANGGAVLLGVNYCKADSLLKLFGTSLAEKRTLVKGE